MHAGQAPPRIVASFLAVTGCTAGPTEVEGTDAGTSSGASDGPALSGPETTSGSTSGTSNSTSASSGGTAGGAAEDVCGPARDGMAGRWARFTYENSQLGDDPTSASCTLDVVVSDAVTRLECVDTTARTEPFRAFLDLGHPALQKHLGWLRDEPAFDVRLLGPPFPDPGRSQISDPGGFALFLPSGEPVLVSEHHGRGDSGPVLFNQWRWDTEGQIIDDDCAERSAARVGNDVEQPLGISLESDDGPVKIYDQQVRQIAVDGVVSTVFVFDAYDTIVRSADCSSGIPSGPCPPDGVYFAIVSGAVDLE